MGKMKEQSARLERGAESSTGSGRKHQPEEQDNTLGFKDALTLVNKTGS